MTGARVEDLGGGVAKTPCGDCNGTGLFTAHPEPHLYPPMSCVRCKSKGKIFIMFYRQSTVK